MCYPCTHCNKCGRMPQPGLCGVCGHVNGLDARVCTACGFKFPAPPGKPGASANVDDGQNGAEKR